MNINTKESTNKPSGACGLSIPRRLAGLIANSPVFGRGRRLFEENSGDWNLDLSKMDKLQTGGYIILRDYADGRFPPVFEDQQRAYQAEVDKFKSLPGMDVETVKAGHMQKPFWGPSAFKKYTVDFARLWRIFETLGLQRGSRLLELGCGSGWMAEFFANAGYHVLGTSIAPVEIAVASARVEAMAIKGLKDRLSYAVSPMESVDTAVSEEFDAVYVFEALHHAFDWKEAVAAAYRCLKPGGWLVLASEPNVLHTFIAYRVARLSNTHEIGFRKRDLRNGIMRAGFSDIRQFAPKLNNLVSQHWIAARKQANYREGLPFSPHPRS